MSETSDLKSFSKDLKALENLVQDMEQDDLDLDQALLNFEKGIALSQKCQKTLTQAELKITTLTKQLADDNSD